MQKEEKNGQKILKNLERRVEKIMPKNAERYSKQQRERRAKNPEKSNASSKASYAKYKEKYRLAANVSGKRKI